MSTLPSLMSSLSIRFISMIGTPISGSMTLESWRWTSFISTSSVDMVFQGFLLYLSFWTVPSAVHAAPRTRRKVDGRLVLQVRLHLLCGRLEVGRVDLEGQHL